MARRVHDFTTSRFGGRATVTGYRDAQGQWNNLNPRTGGWYTGSGKPGGGGRHRGRGPTDDELAKGRAFGVQVDYRGVRYHYTIFSPVGLSGRALEADFRARIRAGYFRKYGTDRRG